MIFPVWNYYKQCFYKHRIYFLECLNVFCFVWDFILALESVKSLVLWNQNLFAQESRPELKKIVVSQSMVQDDPHQNHLENLLNTKIRRPTSPNIPNESFWRWVLCRSPGLYFLWMLHMWWDKSHQPVSIMSENFKRGRGSNVFMPRISALTLLPLMLAPCDLPEDSALSTPANWGPSFCLLLHHPLPHSPNSGLFLPCSKCSRTLRSLILTNFKVFPWPITILYLNRAPSFCCK